MTNTDYQRGYYAGSKSAWPEHRPPYPPHPLLTRLFKAGMTMRDRMDWWLATMFADGDTEGHATREAIDAWDEAMMEISEIITFTQLGGTLLRQPKRSS